MKPTPLPWRVDLTYPRYPQIVSADDTLVNVDFENAADAFLIVKCVNAAHGFMTEVGQTIDQEREYNMPKPEVEYVEWWGVPVRLP